jgi:glycosyltransferase involved in cell wall biosynthesis
MLSIVIPIFNERRTIAPMMAKVSSVLPGVTKQIVAVDDCSKDGTREWLRRNVPGNLVSGSEFLLDDADDFVLRESILHPGLTIQIVYHDRNKGKGAAVQTGLAAAKGDVIIIQDSDLEYKPQDWTTKYDLIAVRKVADVICGCRFFALPHRSLFFHHYLGNRIISLLYNFLYNQTLSDIEACYKMFTREIQRSLKLTCDDFGCEIQLSAQMP